MKLDIHLFITWSIVAYAAHRLWKYGTAISSFKESIELYSPLLLGENATDIKFAEDPSLIVKFQ